MRRNEIEGITKQVADDNGMSFGKSFTAFGGFTIRQSQMDNGRHVGVEPCGEMVTLELRDGSDVEATVHVDADNLAVVQQNIEAMVELL